MMGLHGSALMGEARRADERNPLVEAPLRSWSFLSSTLICLACISIAAVIVWKYSGSRTLIGNVLVMVWILSGWVAAFRYRRRAYQLFGDQKISQLAVEKSPHDLTESRSIAYEALRAANHAIDTVLFQMALGMLVLLVEMFVLLSGK
jgi:type VI protein secretion system component VasK